MVALSAQPSITAPLSEKDWDKLTNLVLEGCVVPVVGRELLVSQDQGQEQELYNLWGRALAEQAGLAIPEGEPAPTLYEVTNEISQNENPGSLAYDIDAVIRRGTWPMPEAVRKLAEIKSFSLYVTTTIDHQLKGALEQARRLTGQTIEEIRFMPHGMKSRIDLPADFADAHRLGVFYLFGASSPVEGTFAKTEDDLIEFSWSLLDEQYAPAKLYDYLQQKTVLLLGCSFPDWLGRFLFRALQRDRRDINIYYVSAHCDAGLTEYLKRRHATKVVTMQSPASFVEELHQRWQGRYRPAGFQDESPEAPCAPPEFKNGAVFLSYASEDRPMVREIRDQLEAANIDTWMDERGLEPGEEFQRTIRENIRNASFFIAIISRSLDRYGSRGRYLWKEWKCAKEASEERHEADRYLQPVAIDDTPPTASFVDSPFRDLHWTRLQDGQLPPAFLDSLRRGIRNYRRSL